MKKTVLMVTIATVCAILAGYGIYVSAAGKATEKVPGKEAPSPAKKDAGAVKADSPGEAAATVNGKPISKADLQAELDRFDRQVSMMGRAADDKQISEMRQQILGKMVGIEVLKQEAAKLGFKASEAETDAHIQALKAKVGSPEDFTKALAQMGMTEQGVRERFASETAIRKLIDQEVAAKIVLESGEAKAFYDKNPELFKTPEQVRASHILVKVDSKASPEEKAKAQAKIQGVEKKIKGGADFAQLAKEVSDCPSKEQGGDLDFFERGQMVGPFEQAAFALKPNEVSGVVETEFGYHLIKVTDHKDAGAISFEEVKPRLEQHLKSEKVNQQLALYVDKLKSAAKIEILAK